MKKQIGKGSSRWRVAYDSGSRAMIFNLGFLNKESLRDIDIASLVFGGFASGRR